MLTYENILNATTKLLSDNFNIDVFVEDSEGLFDNECFYVQLIPGPSIASTRTTDSKSLMLSIKYFNGSKLKNYNISNQLENLFSRTLKVNERFLNISSTEPNVFNDEVGSVLDFLINISYFDEIKQVIEEYENMKNINIEMRG